MQMESPLNRGGFMTRFVLAFLMLFGVLSIHATAVATPFSECYSQVTTANSQKLESSGGRLLGELKYEISNGSFGNNHYWGTVSASQYEMPDGVLKIATCNGILTKNLKKGPLTVAGAWFKNGCASPDCRFGQTKTFVKNDQQGIAIVDYTLDQFGAEQVVFNANISSPEQIYPPYRERGIHVKNGIARVIGQQLQALDAPLVMNLDSSGHVMAMSATIAKSIGSNADVVPNDSYVFEAKGPVQDQTRAVQLIEETPGHVVVSPAVVEYASGEALVVKVINATQYNIELNGATIADTFLQPAVGSKKDEIIFTVGGPSLIKVNLPWASHIYLELKTK
jgi:hypothetical protein